MSCQTCRDSTVYRPSDAHWCRSCEPAGVACCEEHMGQREEPCPECRADCPVCLEPAGMRRDGEPVGPCRACGSERCSTCGEWATGLVTTTETMTGVPWRECARCRVAARGIDVRQLDELPVYMPIHYRVPTPAEIARGEA